MASSDLRPTATTIQRVSFYHLHLYTRTRPILPSELFNNTTTVLKWGDNVVQSFLATSK